jgi:hypothetical protein
LSEVNMAWSEGELMRGRGRGLSWKDRKSLQRIYGDVQVGKYAEEK